MSKLIYICYNSRLIDKQVREKVASTCDIINADNIVPQPTVLGGDANIIFGIANPNATTKVKGSSVLLGQAFETKGWDIINSESPDGNYAIIRSDREHIEVVTDVVGTRTVWYYKDDELFIASTSQRAIIAYLGSFDFEEKVIPWIISTGSLGPVFSWDKRIKRVHPDSKLNLNRKNWTLSIKTITPNFEVKDWPKKKHRVLLKNSLLSTFESINLDFSKWVLTLSGGFDSRAILLLLSQSSNNLSKLRAVTWGTDDALTDERSDACVAKEVAAFYDVGHKFYKTNTSKEALDIIIDRFLKNGEGRIDHIAAYTDGFEIWKTLYEDDNQGVIRGDEVFGWHKVESALAVRRSLELSLCTDFPNLGVYDYITSLEQIMPKELEQLPLESLAMWRDRLYQQYRIPVIQSALADLKYPYVEQVSPLLSKRIVSCVRQLPDRLRNDKALFKEIIISLNPDIKFAVRGANEQVQNILKQPQFLNIIIEELGGMTASKIFPESFLKQVIKNVSTNKSIKRSTLSHGVDLIKKLLPLSIKKKLFYKVQPLKLDNSILAFRLFIICKMYIILSSNAITKD